MFDPGVVHHDGGITHSRDEVNKESIPVNLEKPDRIANFAFEAFLAEKCQKRIMHLSSEQVKVLGIAADSRMRPQRERSCDRIGNFSALEQGKDLAKEKLLAPRGIWAGAEEVSGKTGWSSSPIR